MSTRRAHVLIEVRPLHDGSVATCRIPALQTTVNDRLDADDVLSGTTVCRDGFWDEVYHVDTGELERTLVDAEGASTTRVLRHGPIEVGTDWVTDHNVLVARRSPNGWTGHLEPRARDLLEALRQRHPQAAAGL